MIKKNKSMSSWSKALLFVLGAFLIYAGFSGFQEIINNMNGAPVAYRFGYGVGSFLSIMIGSFCFYLSFRKEINK